MLPFIALRYLVAHLRQSLVCIAGVTISVTMFITMQSMMSGFSDKFIIETVESTGHVTIHDEFRVTRTDLLEQAYRDAHPDAVLALEGVKPREQVRQIKNPGGLIAQLRRMPHVVAAAPTVQGDVIATYGTKTMNLGLLGVEPDEQTRVTTIGENLVAGSFDRLKGTANGVIIGRGVSSVLGAGLGDTVTLSSPTGGQAIGRVVGIFDTGVTPVDYGRGYMLLSDAQTLLDRRNVVNEIVIRTTDYMQARPIARQIEEMAGYKTESWQEASANFLKIFRIQTLITYIITAALLIVAAFGVLNILIMAVLERVNDIAILKSFGLSRGDITIIYVVQGVAIGVVGATLGLGFAKLAVEGLRRVPIRMEGLVRSDGLLMSEHGSQYVIAFVAALGVTLLAAVYPARRAAGYDPVEVIRGAH